MSLINSIEWGTYCVIISVQIVLSRFQNLFRVVSESVRRVLTVFCTVLDRTFRKQTAHMHNRPSAVIVAAAVLFFIALQLTSATKSKSHSKQTATQHLYASLYFSGPYIKFTTNNTATKTLAISTGLP